MADRPALAIVDAATVVTAPGGRAVRDALVRDGSFYVANHGAGASAAALLAAAERFFALSLAEQLRVAAEGPHQPGYHGDNQSTRVFTVNRTAAAPERGVFVAENRWPSHPAGLQPAVERYLDDMHALAMQILGALARALELPPAQLERWFGEGAIENLQLRCYDPSPLADYVPLDVHSDPPPITLIAQDDVGGLESLVDGHWLVVSPLPATLVCQVGEMMARWTTGRIAASRHRVVGVPGRRRYSIVYNLLPRAEAAFVEHRLRRNHGFSGADEAALAHAQPATPAPEPVVARWRREIDRVSRGDCRLVSVSRAGASVHLVLAFTTGTVELALSPMEPGRPCYRTVAGIDVRYRGDLDPPAVRGAVDAIAERMAPAVAHMLRPRTK